jgi:hypothetical protein
MSAQMDPILDAVLTQQAKKLSKQMKRPVTQVDVARKALGLAVPALGLPPARTHKKRG